MLLKYLGFCGSKNANSSKKYYPTVIEELCHQFSLEDMRKSTNNFDEKLIIGKGGYGTVYKGSLKQNGATDRTIALKRLKSTRFLEFQKEIELLCQLRHPHLISLIGFCDHEKEKITVYEYMPNGSLNDHLYRMDMEPLSWKKRLEICIGAAHGLHYLHTQVKRTIIHRDIKPIHILLDNNMVPKLCGFGICVQGPLSTSNPKPPKVDVVRGTIGYIAPEYLWRSFITDKCDVFSFGMVLLQVVCTSDRNMIADMAKMLANNQLGESESKYDLRFMLASITALVRDFPIEDIVDPILKGKIAPECWEVFIGITKRCLKFESDERPTIGEVGVLLEHALSLQEEADIRNTGGDYALLSTTMIFEPSICRGDQESDDNTSGDYSS